MVVNAKLDRWQIEEFTRPTIVALTSKSVSDSIKITGIQKIGQFKFLKQVRLKRDKTTIFVIIFTNLIIKLLTKHISKLGLVSIDHEYTGYEPLIKNRVISVLRNEKVNTKNITIGFDSIGKKSSAHIKALSEFRKARRKQ
jgi:hypothetical protein